MSVKTACKLIFPCVSLRALFAKQSFKGLLRRPDVSSGLLATTLLLTFPIGYLCAQSETTTYMEEVEATQRALVKEEPAMERVSNEINLQEKKEGIMLDALELRDMDINDVLKLISAKSGLNIISGKNVQGRVTIYIKNIEVHDALTIILKANSLAYVESDGIVQIMPEGEYEQLYGIKFGKRTQSKVIKLKSLKANDAVNLLNQVKSATGKVIADETSNTVMVEDVPDKLTYMIDYIHNVDLPTKWQSFMLKNVPVEGVAAKITEQITPKIGIIKTDPASNKILIKDTDTKLAELQKLIEQIDIPRVTKVFEISYAKAEDISKSITTLVTKEIGSVQFDARSNKVMVTDIPPKIQEISSIVAALDKKQKEVLIDARIIEITLSDSYDMGIDWSAMIQKYNGLSVSNDYALPATVTAGPKSVITLDTSSYSAVLSMISSMGKTKILSNPHIAVVNNEEAKILIGTHQPYSTSTVTTPSSGSPTTAEAVNFIDVGVKLHVTPTIHDDGYITMKIHPEVSSKIDDYKSTNNGVENSIPIIQSSEVDTIVHVKDGVTIIIGGLIKDEDSHTIDKVPFLGDIPLVGKVFNREHRGKTKTETVIFLTPHIISGDTHYDPAKDPSNRVKETPVAIDPFEEYDKENAPEK